VAWVQFRLETSSALAPLCEDELISQGAAAVTLQDNADQPLFDLGLEEPTLWSETRVTGLFPAHTDTQALWQSLPAEVQQQCLHRTEILEDKDWEREWMRDYHAMQFGSGLWICPSWETPPDPGAANIMLDPGLAFGTGTHPTTAMCLSFLSGLGLSGKTVIDYGCGSGVLAIATLLLGAEHALGVDTDPMAILASRENADRNRIAVERLEVALPAQADPARQADLVIANILAGPLCELAPALIGHLKPGGQLLLSGILQEQAEELFRAYAPEVTLEQVSQQDGWVALAGTRV
jgi:ribosomal protein L11 methyltransferase